MSTGRLTTKHTYGVSARKNCCFWRDEGHLVYVCGNNVVIVNADTKEQQFIQGTSYPFTGLGITSIAHLYSRRLIAVAEKSVECGHVTLYESHSLKKRKTLSLDQLGSKEVVAMSFSHDGKFFVAQGGAPEYNLTLWNVEKAPKLLCIQKAISSDDQTISGVSFCPYDNNVIATFGNRVSKLLRWSEGQLKQLSMSFRRDNANFISHCWLGEDRCVVGTEGGEILLMEHFDFRAVIYPCGNDNEDLVPILSLQPTSRGFIVGTIMGEIRLFERAEENKEQYTLALSYDLPKETSHVVAMASGADDNIVCLTDSQQLFICPLYSSGVPAKDRTPPNFDVFSSAYHAPNKYGSASIVAMDVSLWRPYLVSVAADCTLRVWNTNTKRMEIMTIYEEVPVNVAIHPNGLYLAIAFLDNVKIISILQNEFEVTKEINIRQCQIIKFSAGGSHLAASTGSSIDIIDIFRGEVVSTLRGHVSKIRSLSWINKDSRICSVGSDGTVFYWDAFMGTKRSESKATSLHFTAGCSFSDNSRAFVATPENVIKEVIITVPIDESPREPTEIEIGNSISAICVDDDKRLMFAATNDESKPNSILSVNTEPQLAGTFERSFAHEGMITCMIISRDGSTIYTGDSHGTIVVSEVSSKDGISVAPRPDGNTSRPLYGLNATFDFVDEILVKKTIYEKKKRSLSTLQHTIEELNVNNEHALRVKEMDHKTEVKRITESNLALLASEKEKYAKLSAEKKRIDDEFHDECLQVDAKHESRKQQMNAKYKVKLNAELARQSELRQEVDKLQQRWDHENTALIDSHQEYIRELTEEYEEKLRLEAQLQKKILEDKVRLQQEFITLNEQIDEDADQEIDDMKVKYEHRLKYEEDTVVTLDKKYKELKKRLELLNKDASRQKDNIKKMRERKQRLHHQIAGLDKDIVNHKKEIRERDEVITDKEKRIFELKKKNQELEKFRFVLDYKIKELKTQIAPREKEINVMNKQIDDMKLELDQYHKSNAALNLMISELKLKADGMRRELVVVEERVVISERLESKYRKDLRLAQSLQGNPKDLKMKVIKMYHTYVHNDVDDADNKTSRKLEDPQQIYNRDREQLERSLDALRRAAKGDAIAHKRDVNKMVRENVVLTGQLNEMRKEYFGLSLKEKAIDESGILRGNTKHFGDLFQILGVKDPAEKLRAGRENSYPNPNAGGIFATEGVEEMKENFAPPLRSKTAGPRSPRTVALRKSDSRGRTITTSPGKRRNRLPLAAQPLGEHINNFKTKPTFQQPPYDKTGGGDQWEAWREIQMQNDQMQALEDQLRSACRPLNIDPNQIFQRIDAASMIQHDLILQL